jgi:hypothetical protein
MGMKSNMGKVFKVMTQLSPTGQFIGSLNRSGFNRSIPTSPETPSLSRGSQRGEGGGGKSKGKSIHELERKHSLAQADKGKAQYSKGGLVYYKSIADMESKSGR